LQATTLRGLAAIQLQEQDYKAVEKSIKKLRLLPMKSNIYRAKLLPLEAEYYQLSDNSYLISVPQELGELLFWRVRRQNPVLVKRVFLISLKT